MDHHLERLDHRHSEPVPVPSGDSHYEGLPTLDSDGLLWFAGRWISIPDSQLPVVDLLLHNPGRLVSTEAITTAYTDGGRSGHTASIKTMVARLAGRLRALGLHLYSVRHRGVILEIPSTAHPAGEPPT